MDTVVELSRWQFAITAMLHFLFIPLTLGLALLLALVESAYVWNGRTQYKQLARFWGRLFAIHFVLAVATRWVLVFQFGMNGSYFSHYVGDVFALPLALEAMICFFLAAALWGPYWLGWERLGKVQHLVVTWLIAIAVNASAFWVLMSSGWLQNPVGAAFDYQSYRIELTDFQQWLSNPAGWAKYWHTVAASYAAAMAAVLGMSAHWLKRNPDDAMARQSYRFAAGIGLVAMIMVAAVGDRTPELDNLTQQAKRVVMTGQADNALLPAIEARVRKGIEAYALLQQLRDENTAAEILRQFDALKADLGYATLLVPVHKAIVDATDKQIRLAAQSALPAYPGLILSLYRLMIACGVLALLGFMLAAWWGARNQRISPWLLSVSLYLSPLPWVACIAGWAVAELGKQPWAVAGVLPTFWAVSSVSVSQALVGLLGLTLMYLVLLGAGLWLMRKVLLQRNLVENGAKA